MLKIIAGKHRGRPLLEPQGKAVRPTASRAREALFNIVTHAGWAFADAEKDENEDGTSPLVGARVLDAFAGSGALGLEALSRGAAHATFLDNDAAAIRLIGENVAKLGEAASARVVRGDATQPPPGREPCGLAFLDPPYRSGLAAPAMTALASAGWLATPAIITVEVAYNEDVDAPAGFAAVDERRYGAAKILIFRHVG